MPEEKLTCLDCPAPYGEDGWVDVVIPDEKWNMICPEGGVLCFRCMTKRIETRFVGLDNVPMIVASGPYRDANEEWRLVGVRHGERLAREEINELVKALLVKLRAEIEERQKELHALEYELDKFVAGETIAAVTIVPGPTDVSTVI